MNENKKTYDEMVKEELAKNTPEKRKRMVEMRDARRRIFRKNMQELHDEGFSNREIAAILNIPESSVVTYTIKKVEV